MSSRRERDRATQVALFGTPIGTCAVAWCEQGLEWVQLPEASKARLRARLRQQLGTVQETKPPPSIRRCIRLVERHLGGKPVDFTAIKLDTRSITPFARRVYEALRKVEAGRTVSYGQLAALAGSPGGARAVGAAMARNPWPLVVPCHRVLAAKGKLGGFSSYGGTTTKARLLALEGVTPRATDEPKPARREPVPGQPLFGGDRPLPFDAARAQRALRRADPKLGALMKRVGPFGLCLKRPQSAFAALAEAIVYQQLTGKAASTIFGRVLALFPRRRALHPEDIASTSEAKLRAAGLSRSKTAALQDLADKTLSGEVPPLPKLRRMDDEAIIDALTTVRGIGRWTVEMLLIFQLGRPDVLPSGDWGLRKGFGRLLGAAEPPSSKELECYGERWRPYRTVASWYLWRALELP
ncbi:MAG: methylated-DNA--[protein]-cysteine S-methyltransferase [Deltaproteobacteria bacterium]|nr:methylated-DNA--[protein]-cysteine S-methyltransferase [Deltaproteobacteria bacterium]